MACPIAEGMRTVERRRAENFFTHPMNKLFLTLYG